jgi:hypothetical protein
MDEQLLDIQPHEVKRVIVIVEDRGGIPFDDLIEAVAHVYGNHTDRHQLTNRLTATLLDLQRPQLKGGDAIQ